MTDKKYDSSEVGKALMAKLYSIVSGAELGSGEPLMDNKFVSWYCPGIPFTNETFDFLTQGFVSSNPQDIGKLYNGAQVISQMFDRVPSIEGQFLDTLTETVATSTADTISSIYKDVLRWSRVVDNKLSEKQLTALNSLRGLLSEEVDNIDPTAKIAADLAGEEYVPEKITKSTKMYENYLTYQQEYIKAQMDLEEHIGNLIGAQAITDNNPDAVARITRAAHGATQRFRDQVDIAKRRWESHGSKTSVERAQALIKQITEQSMVVYKDELQKSYEHSFVSNPQLPGSSEFLLTTLLPPNFDEAEGWSDYEFSSIDMDTYSNSKTSKFSASGSAGFFGIGASASGSTEKKRKSNNSELKEFTMKFQFLQTPIIRSGFEPGFFWMRGWDLSNAWDMNYAEKDAEGNEGNEAAEKRIPLSNGENQPNGRMVAYPTSALWIRNVEIVSKEIASSYASSSKDVKAGGSVGWGPLRIKSSGGVETANADSHYNADTGKLTIAGLQCIGTINNLIPKCPNPHPDLKPEDFVGGE